MKNLQKALAARRRARRNENQRTWRARPGGREYEARASRQSYWRKRWNLIDGCTCFTCERVRASIGEPIRTKTGGCGCDD